MKTYDSIARAVFGRPWFIREEDGLAMVEILQLRLAGAQMPTDEAFARVEAARAAAAADGRRQAGPTTGDVAVIPVYGPIIPRADLMAEMSGATSVEAIRSQLRSHLDNSQVAAILFDIDSPGGSAAGVDELATEIREARGQKPMAAISNTLMCSAAYYIGAQAGDVIVTPSSITGSIGCYILHEEVSRMNEMAGITATVIRQPPKKIEANDVEPLSDDARRDIQQIVDDYYDQFVNAIALGRGIPVADVRGGFGQGGVFTAQRAVDAGLADRIGTLDDAKAGLLARAASLQSVQSNARADRAAAADALLSAVRAQTSLTGR